MPFQQKCTHYASRITAEVIVILRSLLRFNAIGYTMQLYTFLFSTRRNVQNHSLANKNQQLLIFLLDQLSFWNIVSWFCSLGTQIINFADETMRLTELLIAV